MAQAVGVARGERMPAVSHRGKRRRLGPEGTGRRSGRSWQGGDARGRCAVPSYVVDDVIILVDKLAAIELEPYCPGLAVRPDLHQAALVSLHVLSLVTELVAEAKPTALMAQVRMPLNFALVIDHSGSMRGAKLRNVREAVKMVIDRLDPTDYISVVIFDDTAQVIIPSMPANDKPGMKAAIDRIQDAGGTTMSLGMVQGLGELRRWNIPNAVNRMILLTDGVTYGDTDRCRQLARDAAVSGISIYPLGIGTDWDESLLDDIGHLSGGMPAELFAVQPMPWLSLNGKYRAP